MYKISAVLIGEDDCRQLGTLLRFDLTNYRCMRVIKASGSHSPGQTSCDKLCVVGKPLASGSIIRVTQVCMR